MSNKCCNGKIKWINFLGFNESHLDTYIKQKKLNIENEEKGYIVISDIKNIDFNINKKETAIYKVLNYGKFTTKTWQIFLTNKSPNDYFYINYIQEEKKVTEHFCHNNDIHRGHYIGNQLDKFLISPKLLYKNPQENKDRKDDINWFFGKGNTSNIYYQTKDANCDSSDKHGQLYFENDIVNFFKTDKGERYIYYEIEDVFFGQVSIGRKLTILKYENDKLNELDSHHVFIPNKIRK